MRKRLRIDNFASIVIVIILTMIVLEFLFIFQVIQKNFADQQNQELSRYVSFVSKSLEDAMELTKDYESLQNENLYEKAKNIRFELQDVEAIDVTSDLLESIKSKYDLTGVAVLAPSDGDVIILNSTVSQEIGESTKSWGYWHKAFQSLAKHEMVDVGKGQSFNEFWAGPKSMSYYFEGYFRYGYIYHPDKKYIINIFVQDDNLLATRAAGSVNDTLSGIRDNVDYIDHIGVVNSETLKAYRTSDYEESGGDPLVLYGDIENTGFTKLDYSVDALMESGDMLFEDLGRNSQNLVLKKLNDEEMLVIIINNIKMEQLLHTLLEVTVGLAVVAGVIILVVNFWMIRKYGALLSVQRERLNLAKSFKRTIQSMPSMIFHCRMSPSGEIMLTYNDGKIFSQEEVVLADSDHVRIDNLYTDEFMDVAKAHLMKAFSNSKSRFEATHNGHVFDVIVSPVLESGINEKTGQVVEIIGFGTDISDRFTRERSAEYLATHDQLTGLPNRMAFMQKVEDSIESDGELCIIYFDLDNFKAVNDMHGHQVGDEVLQVVAERLKLFTNDALGVARMGGDEFVACCVGLSLDEVEVLTQRIIDAICKPIELEETVCKIGASAGISQYPVDAKTPEVLISKADKAMYKSKSIGGNTYKVV